LPPSKSLKHMSESTPRLTAKEAENYLLRAGFDLARQKGSHRIYRKGSLRMALPWHTGKILHPKIINELFEVLSEAGAFDKNTENPESLK